MEPVKIADKLLIGRDEWCQLPQLNIPFIKAKVDTGAKTSALHAVNISPLKKSGGDYVAFQVYPLQGNNKIVVECEAPIVDERYITSSNGQRERRYVICTQLKLKEYEWEIELTLSNRDPLRYRMLLGREAINNRMLIHPGLSCHQGKMTKQAVVKIYQRFSII